jgi:hypothetical protein
MNNGAQITLDAAPEIFAGRTLPLAGFGTSPNVQGTSS